MTPFLSFVLGKVTVVLSLIHILMGGTSKVDYFLSATLNNDNGQLKQDKNNSFDNVTLNRIS